MLPTQRKCLRDLRKSLALILLVVKANAAYISLPPSRMHSWSSFFARSCTAQNEESCNVILEEIKLIAQELWKGGEIPVLSSTEGCVLEGEAELIDGVAFPERAEYFRREALRGCPKSQHSYGLLLWSGFGSVQRDDEVSAKFHAAAASQHHLDGMAVLGGCLRSGTGVKQNVALGLNIIEYCASTGNPTGVNKKAALLESNDDDFGAVKLYEDSFKSGRVNALLLFNLGWCLVNGRGVNQKDTGRGVLLWKEAARKAPDEGSEEASWYLYEEFRRDNPKEAQEWLELAEELGYK